MRYLCTMAIKQRSSFHPERYFILLFLQIISIVRRRLPSFYLFIVLRAVNKSLRFNKNKNLSNCRMNIEIVALTSGSGWAAVNVVQLNPLLEFARPKLPNLQFALLLEPPLHSTNTINITEGNFIILKLLIFPFDLMTCFVDFENYTHLLLPPAKKIQHKTHIAQSGEKLYRWHFIADAVPASICELAK